MTTLLAALDVSAFWRDWRTPSISEAAVDLRAHWVLYLIWAGMFCATFFLMRMLVTRWGDQNVTMKAVVLSLLLHAVAGLWTTTVTIAHESAAARGDDVLIPVRRLVVEGESAPRRELPGEGPVWEKASQPRRSGPSRLDREVEPEAAAALAAPIPDAEAPLVDVVNQRLASAAAAVVPQMQRLTDRKPTAEPGSSDRIPEETAAARPEAANDLSLRTGLGQPAGLATNAALPETRRGEAAEVGVRLNPTPNLAAHPATADARAAARRGPREDAIQMRAGPSPAVPVSDDPGVAGGVLQNSAGQGVPAGTPFARIGGRSVQGATPEPGPERQLASRTVAGRDADPDPSMDRALRGTTADNAADELLPQSVRRELAGVIHKDATRVPAMYRLRNIPQRSKIAMGLGATENSERAVELSLEWLVRHQSAEGFWDADGFTVNCPPGDRCAGPAMLGKDPIDPTLDTPERQRSGIEADAGVTGLAVLAFLGAGYTHEDGVYADNLDRALRWLIRQQASDGFLGGKSGRYARMYCHGMAAIALGEALGMTSDATLREPLARAVQFIVATQNPRDGGWRYVPGQAGDMSIFGWQLMALKSATAAGVDVPRETMDRAIEFLKRAGLGKHGGLAAYRSQERIKPSMTAEALFSRQILGMQRTNPASLEAVEYLLKRLPNRAEADLYYWYYGTLALYHHGGAPWRAWNQALRDNLVASQRTSGHAAGSWDPHPPWGDYGGRVFSTALSTLSLEVYYRFLPLYQFSNGDDEPAK